MIDVDKTHRRETVNGTVSLQAIFDDSNGDVFFMYTRPDSEGGVYTKQFLMAHEDLSALAELSMEALNMKR